MPAKKPAGAPQDAPEPEPTPEPEAPAPDPHEARMAQLEAQNAELRRGIEAIAAHLQSAPARQAAPAAPPEPDDPAAGLPDEMADWTSEHRRTYEHRLREVNRREAEQIARKVADETAVRTRTETQAEMIRSTLKDEYGLSDEQYRHLETRANHLSALSVAKAVAASVIESDAYLASVGKKPRTTGRETVIRVERGEPADLPTGLASGAGTPPGPQDPEEAEAKKFNQMVLRRQQSPFLERMQAVAGMRR